MIIKAINWLEETLLALLLAAMTLVTFSQVVARYVFNAGAVWALEATVFIFAWLILLGASYGVRVGAHIGVELVVNKLQPGAAKAVGLATIVLCVAYSVIMLIGGWDTVALLFLIGIEPEDVCMPLWTVGWLMALTGAEPFGECAPLWVFQAILPIGFGLLLIRFLEAGWAIITGRRTGLALADEVDEAIEQLKHEDAYPVESERGERRP